MGDVYNFFIYKLYTGWGVFYGVFRFGFFFWLEGIY